MPSIERHFRPKTIEEACSLLSIHKKDARLISGGTDLVRLIKCGKVLPRFIVNISGIPGQEYILFDEQNELRIGAQTTMEAIAASPLLISKYPLLATAAHTLGTPQVRRRATIAGNICNASPSAEIVPALIALGASLRVLQHGGERVIPVESLFIGPGLTVLNAHEIATEVRLPKPPAHTGGVYLSHRVREVLDLPIVSVAVVVTMAGKSIVKARIVLGAVGPTALMATAAAALLEGKETTEEIVRSVAQSAAIEAKPINDIRSSAAYRKKIVSVLVARAIKNSIHLAVDAQN